MRWFRAEEPTHEESMELFNKIDQALTRLGEAGMDATPGRVEDLLNAQGIEVTVIRREDGAYVVKKTSGKGNI